MPPSNSRLFDEPDLYSLAINIASFSHLLKRVDFDAVVVYIVLTHYEEKTEPAINRIKRLFEVLSLQSSILAIWKIKAWYLVTSCHKWRKIRAAHMKLFPSHSTFTAPCQTDTTLSQMTHPRPTECKLDLQWRLPKFNAQMYGIDSHISETETQSAGEREGMPEPLPKLLT